MKTTGIKYTGSKRKILPQIMEKVNANASHTDTLLDVFTGSTRVAQCFRQNSYYTISSDILSASEAYGSCFLETPSYKELLTLQPLIDELNAIKPEDGWVTQYYGEAEPHTPSRIKGKKVNAFTKANAMKIDGIREYIEEIRNELNRWEFNTIMTSLMLAIDKVQNSQGHQRAFFTEFKTTGSLKPIQLLLPPFMGDPDYNSFVDNEFFPIGHHITTDVLSNEYNDFVRSNRVGNIIAYLDPPYTAFLKYNWFYHLYDSIYLWDKPNVVGATNRRADYTPAEGNKNSSTWTEKGQAYDSFVKLYKQLFYVDTFIISYSDESLINHNEMIDAMKESGLDNIEETAMIKHQRHALSKSGNASQETKENAHMKVTEYIFTAHRT
jgi:adenine-specific DNA-methyltransferase